MVAVIPAHPRSRGENRLRWCRWACVVGSSPLTRGKRGTSRTEAMGKRLIPAHAGKTVGDGASSAPSPAHPRSRGENGWVCPWRWRRLGSSPLTRGKRRALRKLEAMGRLIPAHAGKTIASCCAAIAAAAHPRSRGENFSHRDMVICDVGSSPLTRGKHCTGARQVAGMRLIPAHAGKTRGRDRLTPYRTAHPRSRGENDEAFQVSEEGGGSSPLTRGKLARRVAPHVQVRLIPAHAGKTRDRRKGLTQAQAHPRSRGENFQVTRIWPRSFGSSPLTRGKRETHSRGLDASGLIPAHAGKTSAVL